LCPQFCYHTDMTSPTDELAAYTFTRGDAEFIHQHEVNARGASENLAEAKPIRIFFSLAGLYLLIEKRYSGRQIQAAHTQMARVKQEWPTFVLPTTTPAVTVEDVIKETPGEKRDAAILHWCEAVWATWAHEHSHIREATEELLRDPQSQ